MSSAKWWPFYADPSVSKAIAVQMRIYYVSCNQVLMATELRSGSCDNDNSNTRKTPCCTQIARFMGPTWGPPGYCRPQMGPMMAPWTLLSGYFLKKWMRVWWITSIKLTIPASPTCSILPSSYVNWPDGNPKFPHLLRVVPLIYHMVGHNVGCGARQSVIGVTY